MIGQKPTEPMSIRGKAVCESGKMYELLQIQKMKQIGLDPEEQVKIRYQLPNTTKVITHSGKIDAVVADGTKKGIEIKSYSNYKVNDISGTDSKIPLPAANNLMQAMLYKYWTVHIPDGIAANIEDIYLMYVNRNDGSVMYFKVELDDNSYPVITAIDYAGRPIGSKIVVADYPGFEDYEAGDEVATPELGRIAELKISATDIFEKFDQVCTQKENRTLPAPDFKVVYTKDDIDRLYQCGRITKRKHTILSGGEATGDTRCGYCSYRTKCLADSGVNFK
jgi:hypothetical protein